MVSKDILFSPLGSQTQVFYLLGTLHHSITHDLLSTPSQHFSSTFRGHALLQLPGQKLLSNTRHDMTRGSHCHVPISFAINWISWADQMLHEIHCQKIKHFISTQILVLAKGLRARKTNPYHEHMWIPVQIVGFWRSVWTTGFLEGSAITGHKFWSLLQAVLIFSNNNNQISFVELGLNHRDCMQSTSLLPWLLQS